MEISKKYILAAAAAFAVAAAPAYPVQDSDTVAVTAVTVTATAADSAVVTLDDCLRIALSESPTVRVADLDVRRTQYSKREVVSQLLPQVSFGGTYSRMLAKQVAYMNMDGFKGLGGGGSSEEEKDPEQGTESSSKSRDTGIKMGLDNSFQVGFNASVPIIAPQLWQSLKLSDEQIATTVEQARASRLNLVSGVKNAYYAYLLAQHSRAVIGESYRMAALTHEIYVKQHSVGSASEYDVLRTSVAMKNIVPQITEADIAISRARMQLFVLMGVPMDSPLKISDSLDRYQTTMYEDALAAADNYANNTTLRQNTLQTRQLERAVKLQRMSWWPTLSLTGNYNWTSSSNGSPFKNFRWNPYSVLGLSLNFPLYQGGGRAAKIRQAQVQLAQAQWQRRDLESNVAMQVNLAKDNIVLNVKQIASSKESVGQAERAYDIMQRSFNIGAVSYLDLRDSELALTQSRLAYYQSIYNYLIAGVELELLTGNAVPAEGFTVPDNFNPRFGTLFTGEAR